MVEEVEVGVRGVEFVKESPKGAQKGWRPSEIRGEKAKWSKV